MKTIVILLAMLYVISCTKSPSTGLAEQSICTETDTNDGDLDHCPPPLYIDTVEYSQSITGGHSVEQQTEAYCNPAGCRVSIDLPGNLTVHAGCWAEGHPDYSGCWSYNCPTNTGCPDQDEDPQI